MPSISSEMTQATSPPSPYAGLTSAEVAERAQRGDINAFEARVGRTYWEIARSHLFNLFNITLFVLLVIVLAFREYGTAFFASFSVIINAFTGMIQEIIAKRKLDRLAALSVSKIHVWRDNTLVEILPTDIVIDDVIPIEPGHRIVVDGRILYSEALEINEAHLTGESDVVLKDVDDMVYSGSFCVAGKGVMIATKVGADSTINRLNSTAKAFKNELTPTQKKIATIIELSVFATAFFVPMLVVTGIMRSEVFLEIIKNLVVFVTSLVPQGLVLAAILSLSYGAISISRRQTLIQRFNAVEALANVTVLCFDKTGTITENNLVVTDVLPLNNHTVEDICHKLYHYTANLSYQNPTANAISTYVQAAMGENNHTPPPTKVDEIPFNATRKWGAITLPTETLILGAPERVLQSPEAQQAAARAEELAARGLRVLALAHSDRPLHHNSVVDGSCRPAALIVMSDRVRDDIRDTLQAFRDENIALKVISGDNLATVKAIAQQAGLAGEMCYTGDVLEALPDADFVSAVRHSQLFARIEPETKRKIVCALQDDGEYVAMVGDGVNDVPALKQANLAIAMNDGAQMAKDVAEIVLLNNALSTLPFAFQSGTRITQIMYGVTKMFLAKNIWSLLVILIAGFMTLPFPLNPIHISWASFGTVNIPAAVIAFRILRPAPMKDFRHDVLDFSIIAGIIGALTMIPLYWFVYLITGRDLEIARSTLILFITLFNLIVFYNINGIDILDTSTCRARFDVFLLGGALGIFTISTFMLRPSLFEFTPPPTYLILLVFAYFLITAFLVNINMRSRRMTRQLWQLLGP
ncbi:MAG: HAD family hydrolase [Chloroflexi bacterium]|nr:MAG: HAD family hydrolase [Chloroflexota bacterium]